MGHEVKGVARSGERSQLLQRPGIHIAFDRLIIGVEGGFEEEDRGDAAGDFHYFPRFVGSKGAAQ